MSEVTATIFDRAIEEAERKFTNPEEFIQLVKRLPRYLGFVALHSNSANEEIRRISRDLLAFYQRVIPEFLDGLKVRTSEIGEVCEEAHSFVERLVSLASVKGYYHPVFYGDQVVTSGGARFNARSHDLQYHQVEWDLIRRGVDRILGLDLNGKLVMDVGTADGFFSVKAAQAGAKVVSMDLHNLNCLTVGVSAVLGGVSDRVRFVCSSIEDTLTANNQDLPYDLIFALGLIYHFRDVDRGVRALLSFRRPVVIETSTLSPEMEPWEKATDHIQHQPVCLNWLNRLLDQEGFEAVPIAEWTDYEQRRTRSGTVQSMLIVYPRSNV